MDDELTPKHDKGLTVVPPGSQSRPYKRSLTVFPLRRAPHSLSSVSLIPFSLGLFDFLSSCVVFPNHFSTFSLSSTFSFSRVLLLYLPCYTFPFIQMVPSLSDNLVLFDCYSTGSCSHCVIITPWDKTHMLVIHCSQMTKFSTQIGTVVIVG